MIYTPNLNLQIPEYTDPASIIDALRDNLMSLDSLAGELRTENELLRSELAKKADKNQSIEWTSVELVNGFYFDTERIVSCTKNAVGTVHLDGMLVRDSIPEAGIEIGILAEGFRPNRSLTTSLMAARTEDNASWSTHIHINPDGSIRLSVLGMPSNFPVGRQLCISTSFPTVEQ